MGLDPFGSFERPRSTARTVAGRWPRSLIGLPGCGSRIGAARSLQALSGPPRRRACGSDLGRDIPGLLASGVLVHAFGLMTAVMAGRTIACAEMRSRASALPRRDGDLPCQDRRAAALVGATLVANA